MRKQIFGLLSLVGHQLFVIEGVDKTWQQRLPPRHYAVIQPVITSQIVEIVGVFEAVSGGK